MENNELVVKRLDFYSKPDYSVGIDSIIYTITGEFEFYDLEDKKNFMQAIANVFEKYNISGTDMPFMFHVINESDDY